MLSMPFTIRGDLSQTPTPTLPLTPTRHIYKLAHMCVITSKACGAKVSALGTSEQRNGHSILLPPAAIDHKG